jgi:hypothetical protein
LNDTVQGRPGTGWQLPLVLTLTVGGRLAAGVGVGSGVGVALGEGVGVGEGLATGGGVVTRSSSHAANRRERATAAAICFVFIVPPRGGRRLQGRFHGEDARGRVKKGPLPQPRAWSYQK